MRFAVVILLLIIAGCTPAPPEWGAMQQLYTSRYEIGENDCSNMSVSLAYYYRQCGYNAQLISAYNRDGINHAWVEVEYNGETYGVDASADKWTTNPEQWRREYDKVWTVDKKYWFTYGDWESEWYTRNEHGEIIATEGCP